jgi:hypothetical protein
LSINDLLTAKAIHHPNSNNPRKQDRQECHSLPSEILNRSLPSASSAAQKKSARQTRVSAIRFDLPKPANFPTIPRSCERAELPSASMVNRNP